MITLYDFELSSDCYKPRLLMGILGVQYQVVPVDMFPGREHMSDWFLALNPLGTVPVLKLDGVVLREAHAMLSYLARTHDPSGKWLPAGDPGVLADIEKWHGFADRLGASASAARLALGIGHDCDLPAAQAEAHRLFRVLDEHLWFGEKEGRDWLCAPGHPTIADIACFPDIVLSEEGGVSRQDYPAIRRWLDRVKRIPGFTVMSGVFPGGPARG